MGRRAAYARKSPKNGAAMGRSEDMGPSTSCLVAALKAPGTATLPHAARHAHTVLRTLPGESQHAIPTPSPAPWALHTLSVSFPGTGEYTSPRSSLSQLQGIRSRQGSSSQKTVMPVSETGCHLVTNPTDSLQTPGAGLQSLRILQQGSWHRAAVPGVTAREAGFPCWFQSQLPHF